MNAVRKKSKELDPYLKGRIGEARIILEELSKPSNLPGTSKIYYTGNFRKDVLDNYTEIQSEKIFESMLKYRNILDLFQSKLPSFTDEDGVEWTGYEYIARVR
jgi:hypothetical protein|tara:strand:+ start:1072 stop:1380 length:309 start_codon:yes stop_codon:yes gene_type:complete